MKKLISLLLALVMALSLVACGSKDGKKNDESVELTVFAAASLTESLTAIGDKYMAEKNVKISFTFDSSGKLLTQIEEGAVCDLFISAAPKQMNALDGSLKDNSEKNPKGQDLLVAGSRIDLLENKVALAVAEGNPKGIDSFDKLADLLKNGDVKLSIGNSDVPVGQYTQKIFNFYSIDEAAIFATVVVIFPLMYRTVRGAFGAFDETLAYAGQTLGLSNTYIFWHIRMPYCRQGVLAGAVLAFARALGEMENGASGAVTDMESLVRRPATQSAARLTGCRNFLSARSCEGGVRLDGWDITLPLSTGDGTCTVAIPDSAVSLVAGPYRAQVFRTILDLNEASVLLRPTWDAAGPLLRVSAPKAAAPVEGAAVAFDLLPEQCLCYR